jgi:hypothetical protein
MTQELQCWVGSVVLWHLGIEHSKLQFRVVLFSLFFSFGRPEETTFPSWQVIFAITHIQNGGRPRAVGEVHPRCRLHRTTPHSHRSQSKTSILNFIILIRLQEDVEAFMKNEESAEAALKRTQANYRFALIFVFCLLDAQINRHQFTRLQQLQNAGDEAAAEQDDSQDQAPRY